MTEARLTLPDIVFIGGTRAALGAGVGLLISRGLSRRHRKSIGFALLAFGIITTIPIVQSLIEKACSEDRVPTMAL